MTELFKIPNSLISRNYEYANESKNDEYRSKFMRDRDRIMYATAFRRLAGKTQIYTVGADDHKRNRLTHTLEVSQIARTIAKALGLNTDLAEAIALAHDFGHAPFGHAGEEILHEIMIPNSTIVKKSPFYKKDCSSIERRFQREKKSVDALNSIFGFKHNLQSVRVAASLEDSYRGENNKNIGLNLTNFTLYGTMIHSNLEYKNNKKSFPPNYQKQYERHMQLKDTNIYAWSLEAYIVRWSDEIAQWHHDLEDALRGEALPSKTVCNTIESALKNALNKEDECKLNEIRISKTMDRKFIADLSHIVVNTLINDIIKTSGKNIEEIEKELKKKKIATAEDTFKKYDELKMSLKKDEIITVSKNISSKDFEGIIKKSIHHSRNVERMNSKGKYIIKKLFEAYYAHPQQLPDGPILHFLVENDIYKNIDDAKEVGIGEARVRFEEIMQNPDVYSQVLLMRRICDHIASMTDHYAMEEYNNLYG